LSPGSFFRIITGQPTATEGQVLEQNGSGVTVEVYGSSFTFKNVDDTALLQSAAGRLEARMKELSEKWRIVDKARLAIMAALEMGIELAELSENAERGRRVARSILESLDRSLPETVEGDSRASDDEPFLLS
jgi:cell division protein ZapA (FtsZ GTPase activity inhibitor)